MKKKKTAKLVAVKTKKLGRPKLSAKEKARRKAEREAAKAKPEKKIKKTKTAKLVKTAPSGKPKRGRPALSDEEKAQRKAERERLKQLPEEDSDDYLVYQKDETPKRKRVTKAEKKEKSQITLKSETGKPGRPLKAIKIPEGKDNFGRLFNYLNAHTGLKPDLDHWSKAFFRFVHPQDYRSSIFFYIEGDNLKKSVLTMLKTTSDELVIEGFNNEEKYPLEKLPEVFRDLKKSIRE